MDIRTRVLIVFIITSPLTAWVTAWLVFRSIRFLLSFELVRRNCTHLFWLLIAWLLLRAV